MTAVIELSPLSELLDKVHQSLHKAGSGAYIHKLEVGKKGAFQFEIIEGDSKQWYCWKNNKPIELAAADDDKIPLAAMLKNPSFAANSRVLSYRPGKRLTLLDKGDHKARVLKGFRCGQLGSMVAKYECAHMAFLGRGINAPDIIEYDTALECLIMVHQEGETLTMSPDTTDLFYLVGEALRGFQDFTQTPDDVCFDSADELAVIDQRAKRLQIVAGKLPEHWPELRERLQFVWEQLPAPKFGLAHRDLHDKQFIQQTNCLALLDFDLMCKADVCLDPANFLAHLVLRNLQGTRGMTQRGIDACGKQLLSGLARNRQPGFWNRLRFYQATSFCRLALVYSLRPRWFHLVPALVTMGHRCLDDLNRIRDE